MVAAILLAILTLAVHWLVLRPISVLLQPGFEVPWLLGFLFLLGLWLFSGPRRSP